MTVSLQRLRTLMGGLLVSYFLIGMGSEFVLGKEIFPIFSWFLFSETPNQIVNFKIVLYSHNDKTLQPPVPFHQAPASMANAGDINANVVINDLGSSFLQGKSAQINEHRKILENNYMKGQVEYGLIKETYNPIQKWNSDQGDQEVLAKFEHGDFK